MGAGQGWEMDKKFAGAYYLKQEILDHVLFFSLMLFHE